MISFMETRTVLKTCLECGGSFSSDWNPQRFCSEVCRFLNKVDKRPGFGPDKDCWRWTGTLHGKGYGHFKTGNFCEKAHRAAFRLLNNHNPASLLVCHRCDNPRCVNPDHLFLATDAGNLFDRQMKGRQAKGERNNAHRERYLTEPDVIQIRSHDRSLIPMWVEKFNVSESAVRSAGSGHSWAYLNDSHAPWPRTRGHRGVRINS